MSGEYLSMPYVSPEPPRHATPRTVERERGAVAGAQLAAPDDAPVHVQLGGEDPEAVLVAGLVGIW